MSLLPSSPIPSKHPLFRSPEKWYPLKRQSNGRIQIEFTPTGKKTRNVLYQIKDRINDLSYTGMTGQEAGERANQHLRKINRKISQTQFHLDVKTNPSNFSFGILYRAQEQERLGELEHAYLTSIPTTKVYNKNDGGGGCAVTTKVAKSDFSAKTLKLLQMTATQIKKTIPSQSYPLLRHPITKRLRFKIPAKVRGKRGVIYGITNGKKWMVGKTEQTLWQRMYAYHHLFFKNSHALAKAVNAKPKAFRLHILHEGAFGEELSAIEKVWIKALNSIKNGYNTNKGGGGGSAQKNPCYSPAALAKRS